MKPIILFLLFIFSLNSFASIVLPKKPLKDTDTILGPDSNHNGVRDDVEIYIFENITKDPKYFFGFLKKAKYITQFNMAENEAEALKYLKLRSDISSCISRHYKAVGDLVQISVLLSRKILNTKKRQEAHNKNEEYIKSGRLDLKVTDSLCI